MAALVVIEDSTIFSDGERPQVRVDNSLLAESGFNLCPNPASVRLQSMRQKAAAGATRGDGENQVVPRRAERRKEGRTQKSARRQKSSRRIVYGNTSGRSHQADVLTRFLRLFAAKYRP
jgi:hypothetical protein